ncbi:sporulation protein, YlmC/YmxH family [Sulfobacillus acidophilus TPY]|uniref:Sporulation protein, YlmC/YmxH family n=1 Tax=Sulfobacillus acidophilus (strain ATCC 700253 / DSM 10332 / NAL) TaxID=679936 RepID=G8U0S9_SULAD|nr:sporulation protein, YlmC/YmxH family [Sulfobacillus acidophilus TPY]AEW05382.1 sporulation protein, YlmC/YmxH family [Sulfobacillus acidophilus DSM 10332]MCY0863449.1 YlmC/YmxH family sporulation protein [Sulfobacillus sp.]
MRMSELASKDIINLTNGGRLGSLGDSDLVIDPDTGRILTIIVSPRGRFHQKGQRLEIPWEAIRRIGPEVMIVDLAEIPKIANPPQ